MSNQGDDAAAQTFAGLINPTLSQLNEAIGQLIEQQQVANTLLQNILEKQVEKEKAEKDGETKQENVGNTPVNPLNAPPGLHFPKATPLAETAENTLAEHARRRLSYAPAARRAGLCMGCGHSPCSNPVSDQQLTDALKAVKLLKAPEGGPFKGIADERTGISFERDVMKNCGRMSSVVLYHYLLRYTTLSAQQALDVSEEWPSNCHTDYDAAVAEIWSKLLSAFSGQATSESLLQSWNALSQRADEGVEEYITRVMAMVTELRLAGLERPEREVKAKLRCGLLDRELQSKLLQHARLNLKQFMEKIVEEVVDRKRSMEPSIAQPLAARPTPPKSTMTTADKPGVPSSVKPGVLSSAKLPPPVIELDEVHLNGINAGQLPSGEPGCARGCRDPSCRGARYCSLKLPNLAPGTCSRCARLHGDNSLCPAINKVCARCNKEGHFGAACRSAPVYRSSRSGRQSRRNDQRTNQSSAGEDQRSTKEGQTGDKQQAEVSNATINIDDLPLGEGTMPDIFAIRTRPTATTEHEPTTTDQPATPNLKGPQVKTPVSVSIPQIPETVVSVMALWDTGATGSFVRADVLKALAVKANTSLRWPNHKSQRIATLADNKSRVPLRGTCSLNLTTSKSTATITAYVVEDLSLPLVIGVPALQALRVRMEFSPQGAVSVRTGVVETPPTHEDHSVQDSVNSGLTRTSWPTSSRLLKTCVINTEHHSDAEPTLRALSASPGQLHHHSQCLHTQPLLNFVDIQSDAVSDGESDLVQGVHQRRPREVIHVDSTRTGRLVADFTFADEAAFEALQGKGWRAAVARARKSSHGKTLQQKQQINEAIDKLLSSGFVGYIKLASVERPPPARSIARLYSSNPRIRGTHLVHDNYLDGHLPVFTAAQAVFRESPTTPCRIVYDMRPVNKLFTLPTVTRWNLWEFLVRACSRPVCRVMDLEKAFNQVLLSAKSAASCATVVMKARTPTQTRPETYMLLWTSMPFGAGPSPGGLEASTEVWIEEAHHLAETLTCPPGFANPTACPPFYDSDVFDYCRPVIQNAFHSTVVNEEEGLELADYVDDYAVPGDTVAQVDWRYNIVEAPATFRGFHFPPLKRYQSWDADVDNKLLGYRLRNDLLSPIFSAEPLPVSGTPSTVTKRMASHTLSSLYDPLGRYIECNMKARVLWRAVVEATRDDAIPPSLTWDSPVPDQLVHDINGWVELASTLPPTPRYTPVRTSLTVRECQILVSCDASHVGWCVEIRTKLTELPIGPRLCAKGGLFPHKRTIGSNGKSTSILTSTVPRLELHSLLQATKELLRLCSALRLSPDSNVSAVIMSDSLINIQRLCRMGDKSEAELLAAIGKKGKCNYSKADLGKLLKVRHHLAESPIEVRLLHLPSALNLADDGSRGKMPSRGPAELQLLEAVLACPNQRPYYTPKECYSFPDGIDDDCDSVNHDDVAALCATAPQAGPLPPPLRDPVDLPTLTESDRETIDSTIAESVKKDGYYGAIRSYLEDGSIAEGMSPARLKRQASNFELDGDGRLFRVVRQRPDATLVRQRVISSHSRDLIDKIILTRHLEWYHLGPQKLTIRLSDHFYWPRQRRTVSRALKKCIPCLKSNAVRQFNSSAGFHHVADLRPGQVQACDIYLPYAKVADASSDRIVATLVMTDLASGFQRIQPLYGSVSAATVCSALDLLYTNSYYPTVLITDNAKTFVSSLTARWCRDRSILQLACPVYAPNLAYWERSHRELSRCLKACLQDPNIAGTRSWFDTLVQVVNHLNDAPYSSDCWLSPRLVAHPHYDIDHFYNPKNASVDSLAQKLTTVSQPAAAEKVREDGKKVYTLRMLDYLNHWTNFKEASRARTLAHHGRPCDLVVGDTVFHLTGQSSKLATRVAGPFMVDAIDDNHKGTVIIRGANHSTCRVWVSNLVKVPPLTSDKDRAASSSTPRPGAN